MNERDLIFEQYKLLKEAEEQPIMKVDAEGTKVWRLPNGKLYREDGPAVERADGTKSWWVNGKRHRVDGPAVELANGDKQWWVNDELHREDGPAIEFADGIKEWFVNSKRYDTPSDWAEAVFKLHKKPYDQKDIDRFLKSILSKGLNDLL